MLKTRPAWLKLWLKRKNLTENQSVRFNFGRDYWTRTSDLAPPRRVRYQLR